MKLQEVCEVYSGYALKEFHDDEEGYPVIKIGNICSDGTLDLGKCQFTNDSVNEKYFSKKGDIYIALSGATTGKIGIITTDDKYIINQRVGIVRRIDDEIPDQYIKYFLMNKTEKILEDALGCAQPNISPKQIGQYEFSKVDYFEMNNVSDILDRVSNVITQKRQELQNLDTLIKSRFVELFGNPEYNSLGWDVEKMCNICDVGSSKRIYQSEQSNEGVPFLRISDLVNRMDTGTKACDLYIPEERYEELEEHGLVPDVGDILLTARGTLGRCYIYQEDDRFYFQDGMITWLSNFREDITPLYISYLFLMDGFRKQIDNLQAGSTVAYLSISMTKKLEVMIPPLELQIQFKEFVVQTDKLKFTICV